MNIDLLFSKQGEPGLLSDSMFPHPVAGVMFDARTFQLTLEFADMDSMELNIPIEERFLKPLLYAYNFQIGTIEDNTLMASRQVPLIVLNDPYGETDEPLAPVQNSVIGYEAFLKKATDGQPVHRDDLGDEESSLGLAGNMNAAVLQYAPQLARQRTMEAAPKAAPTMAPSGPKGPGGMGGGSHAPTPPRPSHNIPPDDE